MVGSLDNAENAKRNFFFNHPLYWKTNIISRSVITLFRQEKLGIPCLQPRVWLWLWSADQWAVLYVDNKPDERTHSKNWFQILRGFKDPYINAFLLINVTLSGETALILRWQKTRQMFYLNDTLVICYIEGKKWKFTIV